jgi:hypothetical protein
MPRSKFILNVWDARAADGPKIHAVVDANGNPFTVELKSTEKCSSDANGVTFGWFAGTSVSGTRYQNIPPR